MGPPCCGGPPQHPRLSQVARRTHIARAVLCTPQFAAGVPSAPWVMLGSLLGATTFAHSHITLQQKCNFDIAQKSSSVGARPGARPGLPRCVSPLHRGAKPFPKACSSAVPLMCHVCAAASPDSMFNLPYPALAAALAAVLACIVVSVDAMFPQTVVGTPTLAKALTPAGLALTAKVCSKCPVSVLYSVSLPGSSRGDRWGDRCGIQQPAG